MTDRPPDTPLVIVDVHHNWTARPESLVVRCVALAGTKESSKLEIGRVTFHGLTEADYDTIIDAIETYRFRKKKRDRARSQNAPPPVQGAPE